MTNKSVTIILPVVNLERAVDFYVSTLGMFLLPSDNPSMAFFTSDSTQLGLYCCPPRQAAMAGWLVEDIDGKVRELRQRGVTFIQVDSPEMKTDRRGIAESEDAFLAWLRDSEGNILTLTQLK